MRRTLWLLLALPACYRLALPECQVAVGDSGCPSGYKASHGFCVPDSAGADACLLPDLGVADLAVADSAADLRGVHLWSPMTATGLPANSQPDLHALSLGSDGSGVYAVGDLDVSGHSTILRLPPATSSWAAQSSNATVPLYGIVSTATIHFAVGEQGMLQNVSSIDMGASSWIESTPTQPGKHRFIFGPYNLRWFTLGMAGEIRFTTFSGAGPTTQTGVVGNPTSENLWGGAFYPLNSNTPSRCYVVGGAGVVLLNDCTSAAFDPAVPAAPTAVDLRAAWFDSAGVLWVVGAGGTVLSLDTNGSWRDVSLPVQADLFGIWGPGASDEVFVVGAGGTIYHHTQAGWLEELSGSSNTLYAILGDTVAGRTWAVGAGLTLLERN